VRVKAPKKMPAPIRYLLSADRTLQRISLRKISTRAEKPAKSSMRQAHGRPRSNRLKSAAKKGPISRVIAVGMVCLAVATALIMAGRPFHSADLAGTPPPRPTTAPQEPVPSPPPLATKKSNSAKLPQTPTEKLTFSPMAAQARTAPSNINIAKSARVDSVGVMPSAPVLKTSEIEPPVNAVPAEAAPKAIVRSVDSVTITGCVESDKDAFWLKDTSGAEVPQSRSWKSGFLKKRPAAIELVDATTSLRLPSYVGQRIAATGTLTNREMHAHSVQPVSGSCR
jgi:hypothetical protein